MKTKLLITALLTISLGLFSFNKAKVEYVTIQETEFEIPENIDAIFQNSCYGCHNSDSKSKKGKKKFNIDKLSSLKKSKLISKLNKVAKTVSKGKMPTKKAVEKYPEIALTEEDKQILISWAESTATGLLAE